MGISDEVLALAFDFEVSTIAVKMQNKESESAAKGSDTKASVASYMEIVLHSLPEDSALRADIESLRGGRG